MVGSRGGYVVVGVVADTCEAFLDLDFFGEGDFAVLFMRRRLLGLGLGGKSSTCSWKVVSWLDRQTWIVSPATSSSAW